MKYINIIVERFDQKFDIIHFHQLKKMKDFDQMQRLKSKNWFITCTLHTFEDIFDHVFELIESIN